MHRKEVFKFPTFAKIRKLRGIEDRFKCVANERCFNLFRRLFLVKRAEVNHLLNNVAFDLGDWKFSFFNLILIFVDTLLNQCRQNSDLERYTLKLDVVTADLCLRKISVRLALIILFTRHFIYEIDRKIQHGTKHNAMCISFHV